LKALGLEKKTLDSTPSLRNSPKCDF
jgi:hypothetical protein